MNISTRARRHVSRNLVQVASELTFALTKSGLAHWMHPASPGRHREETILTSPRQARWQLSESHRSSAQVRSRSLFIYRSISTARRSHFASACILSADRRVESRGCWVPCPYMGIYVTPNVPSPYLMRAGLPYPAPIEQVEPLLCNQHRHLLLY